MNTAAFFDNMISRKMEGFFFFKMEVFYSEII